MDVLSQLIGLLAKGRASSSLAALLQQLLRRLAVIATLVVFTAILIGLFLLGLCYCLYQSLMTLGLSSITTILIMASFLLVVILVFIALVRNEWLKAQDLPRQIVVTNAPLGNRVHEIAEAFVEGFTRNAPP